MTQALGRGGVAAARREVSPFSSDGEIREESIDTWRIYTSWESAINYDDGDEFEIALVDDVDQEMQVIREPYLSKVNQSSRRARTDLRQELPGEAYCIKLPRHHLFEHM